MMRASVLVPGVFILIAASWQQATAQEDCCQTKTVRDAPASASDLNGVYTLKAKEDQKPDPNCMDGCVYMSLLVLMLSMLSRCVYMRDNEEYCFVSKSPEEGATVVCEVSINHFHLKALAIDTSYPWITK